MEPNAENQPQDVQRARRLSWPGRLLLTGSVMALLILMVFMFQIPNPNMILITGLVIFTSLYGWPAGLVCAAAMLLYSMYFFSTDHSMLRFSELNRQKMLTIVLGVALNTAFVSRLKWAKEVAAEQLRESNRVLLGNNAALEQATALDALTGVQNRYALQRNYLTYEGKYLHVMILDVDNFKQINDSNGHDIGDYILREVAAALREQFGQAHCYRYGGDEFLVIHDDITTEVFAEKLRRLRARLAALQKEGKTYRAAFSAGYVFGYAEFPGDLRLMFRHADEYLYLAKGRGKDSAAGGKFRRTLAEETEKILHRA